MSPKRPDWVRWVIVALLFGNLVFLVVQSRWIPPVNGYQWWWTDVFAGYVGAVGSMFVGVATLYLVWKQNQLQESMAVWQRTVDAREMYDRIERDLRLVREQLDAIPNTLENEEIRSKVHEKGLVLMEYLCHLIDVKTIDDPFLIDRSDDLVSEWAPSLWFCELPIREQIDEMALYPKLFHRAQTTDERREAIIQAAVSKANAAIHDIGRIERDFNDKVDRIDQGFVRYWWNRLTGRKSEKRSLPDS